VAALSIGTAFYRPGRSKRVLTIGALCSVIPDLDVIGFRFGIRYGDFWGHRGFTHSLVFAALLAGAIERSVESAAERASLLSAQRPAAA
jgi:inner membrane protein